MNITEIRVKLVGNGHNEERLRAFCSVTLDGAFVIRDLKIIDGTNGPFVAMPSRKLSDRCPKCGCKNHLRAKFCNECGGRLDPGRAPRDSEGRVKLHADVAHPINAAGREQIQREVIVAYERELEAASQPGYQPQYVDADIEDTVESGYDDFISEVRESVKDRQDRRPASSSTGADRHPPQRPPREMVKQPVHALSRPEKEKVDLSAKVVVPAQPPVQDDPFSAGIL